MANRTPLVSIILPTYNRSNVVGRAIESVLGQTFTNFELIVVDDGSTDDTLKILENYNDERIRIFSHDNNKGGSAARNTGISKSDGKYIAFIDSDDEWLRTKLQLQVEKIRSHPSLSIVYTGHYKNSQGTREIGQIPQHDGNIFEAQLARDRVNPTSTVLVDKHCFETVGTFNESLNARQDYEMWLRIAKKFNFGYIKKPLVIMHEGEDRITDNVDRRIRATLTIVNKYSKEIDNLPKRKKRSTLATQYFSMGRYCQKHERYKLARSFLMRSATYDPTLIKIWPVLIASLLRYDMNGDRFIKLKNVLVKHRQLKS